MNALSFSIFLPGTHPGWLEFESQSSCTHEDQGHSWREVSKAEGQKETPSSMALWNFFKNLERIISRFLLQVKEWK
jgi:hypothetical protein